MAKQLQLVQIMGDNTTIPMMTSARGEHEAARAVDLYPNADYHFIYAGMELVELTPDQEVEVFE